MLADALEHLVRGIVEHPDDVVVADKQLRRGSILEVRVHPDDLGKVIGRGGRTATAFRTVVSLAGRRRRPDRLRGRGPQPLVAVAVQHSPAWTDRAAALSGWHPAEYRCHLARQQVSRRSRWRTTWWSAGSAPPTG